MKKSKFSSSVLTALLSSLLCGFSAKTLASSSEVITYKGVKANSWLIKSNSPLPNSVLLNINPEKKFQEIWGFGASVTESCLGLVDKLSTVERQQLMRGLFSPDKGAGFSYLRIPIGANDFSNGDYTLNDTKNNVLDLKLKNFRKDKLEAFIEFIKEAQTYNPEIKIMITPWTAPAWMKDTKKLKGGQIRRRYFSSYADYLIKSVQSFQEEGIPVSHYTLLNEPLIGDAKLDWGFPQTYMSPEDQHIFISDYLVPKVKLLSSFPKLLLHDHNWDNALAVKPIAQDLKLRPYIGGIGMHCYGGDFDSQTQALKAFSGLSGFNTECSSTFSNDNDSGSFHWWLKTHSLDALQAGSSGGLGWNLCLDEKGGPTNNGCPNCRGLVTINKHERNPIKYNAEFFALAAASRSLKPGAMRVESTQAKIQGVSNVAFENPDGQLVMLLRNETDKNVMTSIYSPYEKQYLITLIPARSALSVTLNSRGQKN